MNTKTKKYVFPTFTAAVFALMFVATTPYVIAEPGQEKQWTDSSSGNGVYDHTKKDIKQDMAEKLNSYCEMSVDEQTALIAEHNKTEEMVAKMNEYCSLDEARKQAFIEEHRDEYKKHSEDKMRHDDYNKKHHMKVTVEGFTGTIPIPEMTEDTDMKAVHEDLKTKITVKLSDAAAAAEDAELDIMKGSIGMAVNENGDKSVVWILTAVNMDSLESETTSATMFVVDAADVTNTAQMTKEFDHSRMNKDNGYHHDKQQGGDYEKTLSNPEQIENKIAKIEEKLSEGGTGNVAVDDLKSQFLELLKQLQTAIADGNDVQADSLRDQLNDLRSQMGDMKKFR